MHARAGLTNSSFCTSSLKEVCLSDASDCSSRLAVGLACRHGDVAPSDAPVVRSTLVEEQEAATCS